MSGHPLPHNPDCGVNSTGECDCGIYETAATETQRLQRELDITNADHIALWLEANTIPDEPMSQCISWLACRIIEAHEAALARAHRRQSALAAETGDGAMTAPLEALMTELGDLWYSYVCQDHHKDRDCHFVVSASFSYGDGPLWDADHDGYVDAFPRNQRSFERPKFPTYELALANCVNETLKMFRRHYSDLPSATAERLKAISSQFSLLASADTHPKGGDSTEIEAPFMSGAVPEGQTPKANDE